MSVIVKIFSIISMLILAGCSLLHPVTPVLKSEYVLSAVPNSLPKSAPHTITLLVSQPETKPVYNTTAMMYSEFPYQIASFGVNAWAKTPAQMLQPLIVETLQKMGYFHAIVIPPYSNNYTYSLSTQIFDLLQDYTHKTPLLKLSLRVQIIKAGTEQVIASRVLTINEPILQKTPYGGVIAANVATRKILRQLASFVLATIQKSH